MIARALRSLLKHNSRVNIPTLGAIIKQQDFSQALFFNQFIKYNDGLLLHHLTRVEMLTETEAQDLIDQFIRDVQENIRAVGKFQVGDIGIFCFVENRLELLSEKDFALRSSPTHPSPTQLVPIGSPPEQPCEQRDASTTTFAAVPNRDEPPSSTLAVGEQSPSEDEVPFSLREAEKDRIITTSKFKKPTLLFLALLILLLVRSNITLPKINKKSAAAGTIQAFEEDSGKTAMPIATSAKASYEVRKEAQALVEQKSEEPSAMQEADRESEPDLQNISAVPEVSSDRTSSYHIVVGAFTQESNADHFVSTQQALGRDVQKIGFRSGFYFVGFGSALSADSIQKKYAKLRRAYPEAWITKF